jgi:hypothetical protein
VIDGHVTYSQRTNLNTPKLTEPLNKLTKEEKLSEPQATPLVPKSNEYDWKANLIKNREETDKYSILYNAVEEAEIGRKKAEIGPKKAEIGPKKGPSPAPIPRKKGPKTPTVAMPSTDKEFYKLHKELKRIEKSTDNIDFNKSNMAAKYRQSIAEIEQLENNLKSLEAALMRSNNKKIKYISDPEPIFESNTIKDFVSKNGDNIKGFQLEAARFNLNGKIYKKGEIIPYSETISILDRLPKGYILTNTNGNAYFHNG